MKHNHLSTTDAYECRNTNFSYAYSDRRDKAFLAYIAMLNYVHAWTESTIKHWSGDENWIASFAAGSSAPPSNGFNVRGQLVCQYYFIQWLVWSLRDVAVCGYLSEGIWTIPDVQLRTRAAKRAPCWWSPSRLDNINHSFITDSSLIHHSLITPSSLICHSFVTHLSLIRHVFIIQSSLNHHSIINQSPQSFINWLVQRRGCRCWLEQQGMIEGWIVNRQCIG
jgi:hypothetical protein